MDFISGLALILLTLVGYSSGAVFGAKGRTAVPGIADLIVVIILWIGALATRGALGKWLAIGVWFGVGLVVGAVLTWARSSRYPKAESLDKGSGLWNAWKGFVSKIGDYQSRVLLAFAYFSIVLPFGLGVSLLADPLNIKSSEEVSFWQSKESPLNPTVDEARKQY